MSHDFWSPSVSLATRYLLRPSYPSGLCLLCRASSILYSDDTIHSQHSMHLPFRMRLLDKAILSTDSSSSPVKKQRGVTAGIARGIEIESNAIGFGRGDENQDVSPLSPRFWLYCRSSLLDLENIPKVFCCNSSTTCSQVQIPLESCL